MIVLMTSSGDQRALRMVTDNLDRKAVKVEQIDGSMPENKGRRDDLWKISEKRAVYPQVFTLVGDAAPVFVSAGAEEFEDLVEAGTMDADILAQNPGIPTLERALAPLLGASPASAPAPAPAAIAAPSLDSAPAPAPAPARAATPPKPAGTPPGRGEDEQLATDEEEVDPAMLAKLRALVDRLESNAKAKYGFVPAPAAAPGRALRTWSA